MKEFQHALAVMKALFSRDIQFALATTVQGVPSLRFIDAYFNGQFFYVVTHQHSQKVKEIIANPHVALCSNRMHTFNGEAFVAGHPLSAQNQEIRSALLQAFEPWYFRHNREEDPGLCYLKIKPSHGFFHKEGTGYRINFLEKTAVSFPFTFDIVLTDG